jgi:predicted MPP superfamily phosphohydrolase
MEENVQAKRWNHWPTTRRTVLLLGALAIVTACAFPGTAQGQANRSNPTQLRLSWSEDPQTTMTVVWQTAVPTATATVEYGTTPRLGMTASGRRVTYAYETGVIHEVTLRGLKPGRLYYYRAGDPVGGFSGISQFRTAPARPEEFTFTAFGDQGTGPASRKNVDHIAAENPPFHLLLGDFSYANGNQPIWDTWFEQNEPMTRAIPLMSALGNHENETINGKRVGYVAALARLAMPPPETWYTFDYCGVRFVSFNSDDFKNPTQLKWFDDTLSAARSDPKVRWLVVFQHHPLYSSNERRLNNQPLIDTVRKLLDQYQVDLVLAGHNHNYERSYSLRGDAIRNADRTSYRKGEGTVYVVSGGGGKSLYQFTPQTPAITAYRESIEHYLRVHVPRRGPLVVEAVRTRDRTVMDRFEIAPR